MDKSDKRHYRNRALTQISRISHRFVDHNCTEDDQEDIDNVQSSTSTESESESDNQDISNQNSDSDISSSEVSDDSSDEGSDNEILTDAEFRREVSKFAVSANLTGQNTNNLLELFRRAGY